MRAGGPEGRGPALFPQRLNSAAEASGGRIQPDFFILFFLKKEYVLAGGWEVCFFAPTS